MHGTLTLQQSLKLTGGLEEYVHFSPLSPSLIVGKRVVGLLAIFWEKVSEFPHVTRRGSYIVSRLPAKNPRDNSNTAPRRVALSTRWLSFECL